MNNSKEFAMASLFDTFLRIENGLCCSISLVCLMSTLACADSITPSPWEFEEPETPSEPTPEPIPQPTPEPHEESLFAGHWVVDQPAHAGYEATLYHFRDDGLLDEVRSLQQGSGKVPTGRVARCESRTEHCVEWGVECIFSDSWRSRETVLFVTSQCSDGVVREVELRFSDDLSNSFLLPEISVNGEENWEHNDFDWSWRKCLDPDTCLCEISPADCPNR